MGNCRLFATSHLFILLTIYLPSVLPLFLAFSIFHLLCFWKGLEAMSPCFPPLIVFLVIECIKVIQICESVHIDTWWRRSLWPWFADIARGWFPDFQLFFSTYFGKCWGGKIKVCLISGELLWKNAGIKLTSCTTASLKQIVKHLLLPVHLIFPADFQIWIF